VGNQKMPTRVTLEITADEYTKRIFAGDELISELTMIVESPGSARGTKANYEPYDEICGADNDEEFISGVAEAFDDLCGFDMAASMYRLREES